MLLISGASLWTPEGGNFGGSRQFEVKRRSSASQPTFAWRHGSSAADHCLMRSRSGPIHSAVESPAKRPWETQSSPFQRIQHQAQGSRLHTAPDPNAVAAGKLNLNGARARCGRRLAHPFRRHHYGHKLRHERPVRRFAVTLSPTENEIGVHIILPCHHRHRCPRRQRRRHDLTLERFRPRPMPPPDPQTCVHYLVRGHFRFDHRYESKQPASGVAATEGGPYRRDTQRTDCIAQKSYVTRPQKTRPSTSYVLVSVLVTPSTSVGGCLSVRLSIPAMAARRPKWPVRSIS